MRNSLLIRSCLIIFLISSSLSLRAQSANELYRSKFMAFDNLVEEELYHSALQWTNTDHQEIGLLEEMQHDKLELISKLRTNYPELHSELYVYGKQLKNDPQISDIITALVKKESSDGLIPKGQNVIQYAQSLGIDKKESNALSFYYAYELFKKKQYQEAIRNFQPTIKNRSAEYNYSLYYSGMASLLMGDYESSRSYLLKIGHDPKLETYLPYYLAANHYALQDYDKVIKYYADRTRESKLYNTSGINKIVSYAYYNNEQYDNATQYLANIHNKTPKDQLLLAISLNKAKKYQQTVELLATTTADPKTEVGERISFEKALALGAISNYDESIRLFNSLTNSHIDNDLLRWNITLLMAQKSDYSGAIAQAQNLLGTKYHQQAQQLIQNNLDKIEDPNTIAQISNTLAKSSESKEAVTDNLYYRALSAIQASSWSEADSYIDILRQTDAYSSQYFELLGYKGLQQYQDGNINEAKQNLTSFAQGASTVSNSDLTANVHYHLGYLYFKEKNPETALGYFTKSLDLSKRSPSQTKMVEDLYNRIGDVYLLQNNLANAESNYQLAINTKGTQADYALFQLALIDELHGQYYDQIIHLGDLISEYPHSSLRYKAELATAHSLFELGKYEQAENHYREVSLNAPDQSMIEESVIQLGLINVNAGNYAQAEQYYQRIIHSSKNDEMKSRAVNSLKEIYAEHDVNTDAYIAISTKETDNVEADQLILNLAKDNFYNANYAVAIEQLKKLQNEYPNSDYKDEASSLLIDAYVKGENWILAADQLIAHIETSEPKEKNIKTDQLGEILFSKIKEYQVYLKYSEQGWFAHSPESTSKDLERRALSYLEINEIQKCRNLLPQLAEYPINNKIKEEIGSKLLQSYLAAKNWDEVLQLNRELPDIKTPKWIYAESLALMNQEKYKEGIDVIITNNELLSEDNAWLVKSVILMSDMYYLLGDKTSAIAVLEGMLASDLTVPPTLKKQAEERLNNFNL